VILLSNSSFHRLRSHFGREIVWWCVFIRFCAWIQSRIRITLKEEKLWTRALSNTKWCYFFYFFFGCGNRSAPKSKQTSTTEASRRFCISIFYTNVNLEQRDHVPPFVEQAKPRLDHPHRLPSSSARSLPWEGELSSKDPVTETSCKGNGTYYLSF
jgi:hypothetical protein